jgi:hypothetical protein
MNERYKLVEKEPILVEDLLEWARWYETADRHVAKDALPSGVKVSTVFLGLDHRYDDGPPLLFETMIFGGEHDEYQERYSTWDEAFAGHQRALALAKGDSGR